jgi:hypothetical protein
MPSPDPTPDRVDAILAGGPPRGPAEEGIAEVVTALRATDGASPALRARVAGMAAEDGAARAPRRRWGARAMVLAPACALLAAGVVTVLQVTGGGDAPAGSASGVAADSVAPSAAAPSRVLSAATVTVRVPRGRLVATGARVRAVARSLGGGTSRERYLLRAGGAGTATIVLAIPPDQVATARGLVGRIGSVRASGLTFRGVAPSAASPAPGTGAPAPLPVPVTVTVRLVAR